jgi:hypothetical protein
VGEGGGGPRPPLTRPPRAGPGKQEEEDGLALARQLQAEEEALDRRERDGRRALELESEAQARLLMERSAGQMRQQQGFAGLPPGQGPTPLARPGRRPPRAPSCSSEGPADRRR